MRNDSRSAERKTDYPAKYDKRKSRGNKYRRHSGKTDGRGNSDRSPAPSASSADVDNTHTNDIAWWNKAAPLFQDATRVPFNRIQGDPLVSTFPTIAGVSSTATFDAIPGIMAFRYLPSIGYAQDSNDPVNRAFTSIYGDIYSRTTGAMQFTQSDLALFVLGVSSIVQMIGVMKRALGTCQLYAAKNYYYPLNLLTAQGFTASDIISNQDDYRRRLNQAIQSVNAMKVPNFIDLFKRHYTLSSNVWLDEDSPDAQMFVFVPAYYYAYDDTNSKLTATSTLLSGSTGASFLTKIESALALWRNSSDLGLISGSIQRAYKDSSLLSLDMVSLDSVVLPTFDKTMLRQINNATILNAAAVGGSSINVTQNVVTNVTTFTPKLLGSFLGKVQRYMMGRNEVLINSFDGAVTPDDIMEMTRMTTFGYDDGTDIILKNCGTELILDAAIHWFYKSSPTSAPVAESTAISGSYQSALSSDASKLADFLEQAAVLSKFRNAPRIELSLYTGATEPFTITARNVLGDTYVYTMLDRGAYEGLQSAALQSIYVINELTKPNNFGK